MLSKKSKVAIMDKACTEAQRTPRFTVQGETKEAHRIETSWSRQSHGGYAQNHSRRTHGYRGTRWYSYSYRSDRDASVAKEYNGKRNQAVPTKCLLENI